MKNVKVDEALYWDGYFMALAFVSAKRSKDPSTKVGACIVNEDKKVVSLGYNGMPKGNDEKFPWGRDAKSVKDNKYAYVIHAEINSILNTNVSLKNCVMYTSLYPCSNCAKTIVQSGIKEIVYQEDKYHDEEDAHISREILRISGIKTRIIKTNVEVSVIIGGNKN